MTSSRVNNEKSMYRRKRPLDLSCPLRFTLSLIGSKWKSCIIDELREEPLRPSLLQRRLPGASERVIAQCLKEMCEDGLIEKKIFSEIPPHTEYSLTAEGRSLLPLIDDMIRWGEEHDELMQKKLNQNSD